MRPGALRPLGIGEMLDASFKIYFRRFVPMAIATALTVFPVLVISGLIQISSTPEFFEQVGTNPFNQGDIDPETLEFDGLEIGLFAAGNIVAVLLSVVGGSIATAATLQITAGAYLGTPADWRQSIRFAVTRLLPVIGLSILSGLGVLFGFFLCVIPGVILWVIWAVAMPAMLLEDGNQGVMAALGRSRHLVKGRFWETFAILVLALLINLVIGSMFTGLAVAFPFVSNSYSAQLVFQTALGALASVITTPFSAAITAVLYFDLRVRKEGYDLELLANAMSVDAGLIRSDTGLPASTPIPVYPPPPGWIPAPGSVPPPGPIPPPRPDLPPPPRPTDAPPPPPRPTDRPAGPPPPPRFPPAPPSN